MPHAKIEEVRARAEAGFEDAVSRLCEYLKVPAISCDKDHAGDVKRLAERVKDDLVKLGFDDARVLHLDGALPCVAAERRKAGADRPTVLIYGHLDLQPVKGEPWSTPPHDPTRKGERLYARGAADDMGGWVSHLAAMEAWLDAAGELPCNVKLLIEGEEEIGSPNLERYMDAFPEAFSSDVMVLTDCENPSVDIPGLTVSLRGLLEMEIVCEALSADVHSGLWGNMAPDVSTALVKVLARLVDDDGRLAYGRREVDAAWQKAAWDVPLTNDVVKAGAHLLDGVDALPHHGRPPAEWVWRQPAVTVLTTTLPTPDRQKNALRQKASATISVRVAPGQTREELKKLVLDVVMKDPPGGVKVSVIDKPGGADSWLYEPKGPAFAAADRAYEKAWGKKLLQVGVGGSIPFVALFGRRYGDLPLILNGVMDPETSAHGPDESLHLGVFKKAILANVYLLDELAALPELVRKA
jgi:acetylornithine deacetylase/succinyl-diaminopimelate desuccinylase-like protein